MHLLERDVILNASAARLWEFLATPNNLNLLTPAELRFKILTDVPDEMYNGLTIRYEIQVPLFGKRRWLTEIKHIREGCFFVDEQRLGPFRFWYHQHQLNALTTTRSRMSDRVYYQLPYGPVGALVHELWVKKMLARIFDFRTRRLLELFG